MGEGSRGRGRGKDRDRERQRPRDNWCHGGGALGSCHVRVIQGVALAGTSRCSAQRSQLTPRGRCFSWPTTTSSARVCTSSGVSGTASRRGSASISGWGQPIGSSRPPAVSRSGPSPLDPALSLTPSCMQGGDSPSSGFLAILLMMQLCQNTRIYGFSLGGVRPPPAGASCLLTRLSRRTLPHSLPRVATCAACIDSSQLAPPAQECTKGCNNYHYFNDVPDNPRSHAYK